MAGLIIGCLKYNLNNHIVKDNNFSDIIKLYNKLMIFPFVLISMFKRILL